MQEIEVSGFEIFDRGDPSVGIFPRKWEIVGSFYFDSYEELKDMKTEIQNLFESYAGEKFSVKTFEEIEKENEYYNL